MCCLKKSKLIVCIALMLGMTANIFAITILWDGDTSRDWHDKANWDYDAVPASRNDVVINQDANCADANCIIYKNAACHNLSVSNGSTTGPSRLTLNAGTLKVNYCAYLGNTWGNNSIVDINGGTFEVASWLYAGYEGNSTINLDAGTIKCGGLSMEQSTSLIDIKKGTLVVDSYTTASTIKQFVTDGKIKAYSGTGTVVVDYNSTDNKTFVTATVAAKTEPAVKGKSESEAETSK